MKADSPWRGISILLAALFVALFQAAALAGPTVSESARDIPVAYDADVVVVGGSSGAVAAASAAARSGADVFLAAPHPYLGEDMCATYRLWLEPDQELHTALAERVYKSSRPPIRNGLSFDYEADQPSARIHPDTDPPSVLSDGTYHDAARESVQYDKNVTITLDLGKAKPVRKVHVMAYQRPGEFEVKDVRVALSKDGDDWQDAGTIRNDRLDEGGFESPAMTLSLPVETSARYAQLEISKTADAQRILLGEIVIEGPQKATTDRRYPPTPMNVKKTLDQELLDAGVEFLYACQPCEVLRDENGKPAGIVMANFSGRQAVLAKVIIDATERGQVARMCGADFTPYPAGTQTFTRIVVGKNLKKTAEGGQMEKMPTRIGPGLEAMKHTLKIDMPDASYAAFAEAENVARDRTWQPGQMDASEKLFQVPPDHMAGKARVEGSWPGWEQLDLSALRPADQPNVYVLGGCADLSRDAARKLVEPPTLMAVGDRVGRAASKTAAALAKPENVRLAGEEKASASSGDTRELLKGVRPGVTRNGPTVPAQARSLPVLADYEVVVVGGGTGGAPAGIAAARNGARTLVVEYLYNLGGVGTSGLITKYYHGYRKGFTAEIDAGIRDLKGASFPERKMEWWRRELRKAGADIWFGSVGCGAFVESDRVKGVVVATPHGRGVVLADVVIDSTGKADIAVAAGAERMYTNASHVAVQGSGLPPRPAEAGYVNTDWTIIDDTDMVDLWRSFVLGRKKYNDAYDMGVLADTRERRRMVGDFVISPLDIQNHRTYPDTIAIGKSNFDTHGFTIHPTFTLKFPHKKDIVAHIPYRALLPRGLEGMLVTGLGISAHRDAMPILRMQPDIQNEGYAAGMAAAAAVEAGRRLRQVDIEALQKRLAEKEILPEDVPAQEDNFPRPEGEIAQAVEKLSDDYAQIGLVLAQPKDAMPHLREAYQSAQSDKAKLIYAHVLAMMNDDTGAATLAETVRARDWDKGWQYTGMGQFGGSMSRLDSLIIGLGNTGSDEGLEPILEKVKTLEPDRAFSHFRAVGVALEKLGDRRAAPVLAELLRKGNIMGHAAPDIEKAEKETPLRPGNDTSARSKALRELILARALYRCGDHDGLGRSILEQYEHDVRGHMARHAHAVLEQGR